MRVRRACTGLGGAALLLSLLGCSLDDRPLSQNFEFAGSGNSASGNNGGGDSAGAGGLPSTAPLPTDCDYSKDARPDCQSLVDNPGFAVDTAGWNAEMGPLTLTWKSADATEDPASGSLSLLNAFYSEADGPIALGAYQCLPARAGTTYSIAGDVFVPKGQGDGFDGGTFAASAGFSIIFKDDTACEGHTLFNVTSDLVKDPETWTHREVTGGAPRLSRSMNVRLITLKNFREYKFEALFDNVLVKAR